LWQKEGWVPDVARILLEKKKINEEVADKTGIK